MNQYLFNTNFFDWAKSQPDHTFDAIVTDQPYKTHKNKKSENLIKEVSFDTDLFCNECVRLLKPMGIFVGFCSIHLLKDYFQLFHNKLRFRCEQIWYKFPNQTWITYSVPLRQIEYIAYFGDGKLDFRTGEIGKKWERGVFGGRLKGINAKNTKQFSEGQYGQILKIPITQSNKNDPLDHPTKKPIEFSFMFRQVLGHPERVLDPCCGSGSLIYAFDNAIGLDIGEWNLVKYEKKPSLSDFL